MKSALLQALIHQATQKAYENVADWMGTDSYVASQLRDGLRTALEAFDDIDDEQQDADYLLHQLQNKLSNVLNFYQQLPGSQGEWECSALSIARREVDRLIEEAYTPTEDELLAFELERKKKLEAQFRRLSSLLGGNNPPTTRS